MIWVVVNMGGEYLFSLVRESPLHMWTYLWSTSGFQLMHEREARELSRKFSEVGVACSATELSAAPSWKQGKGCNMMRLQYVQGLEV